MGVETGAFVRVVRDGRGMSLDIATLTNEELETFFAERTDPEELRRWAIFLAKWIRDHVFDDAPPPQEGLTNAPEKP